MVWAFSGWRQRREVERNSRRCRDRASKILSGCCWARRAMEGGLGLSVLLVAVEHDVFVDHNILGLDFVL